VAIAIDGGSSGMMALTVASPAAFRHVL